MMIMKMKMITPVMMTMVITNVFIHKAQINAVKKRLLLSLDMSVCVSVHVRVLAGNCIKVTYAN